jgi:hypothetical protein
VLFIGSEQSDVHHLAKAVRRPAYYRRVDVGDVDGLIEVLHALEAEVVRERLGDLRADQQTVDRTGAN